MPIATKFGRVKIYNEEFPFVKLQGPLIMWFMQGHVKY